MSNTKEPDDQSKTRILQRVSCAKPFIRSRAEATDFHYRIQREAAEVLILGAKAAGVSVDHFLAEALRKHANKHGVDANSLILGAKAAGVSEDQFLLEAMSEVYRVPGAAPARPAALAGPVTPSSVLKA